MTIAVDLGCKATKQTNKRSGCISVVVVFVLNVPSTAKVIWRRGHGLKTHPTDWWSQESNLRPLVYKASSLSSTPQQLLIVAYLDMDFGWWVFYSLLRFNEYFTHYWFNKLFLTNWFNEYFTHWLNEYFTHYRLMSILLVFILMSTLLTIGLNEYSTHYLGLMSILLGIQAP